MQHAIYLFYHNSRLFDHFVDYKVYACHVTEYFFFFFCRCYDFYAFD